MNGPELVRPGDIQIISLSVLDAGQITAWQIGLASDTYEAGWGARSGPVRCRCKVLEIWQSGDSSPDWSGNTSLHFRHQGRWDWFLDAQKYYLYVIAASLDERWVTVNTKPDQSHGPPIDSKEVS